MTNPLSKSSFSSSLVFRSSAAFTLVELLVAVSVLVLIVVLVAQLVNSTGAVVTKDQQLLDTTGEARLIFDRMRRDFDGMIRHPGVDCTAYTYNNLASTDSGAPNDNSLFKRKGNDGFWFIAESDAYTTGVSPGRFSTLAIVGYRIWEVTNNPSSRSPLYSFERRGDKRIWDTNNTQSGFVFLTFDSNGAVKSETTLRGQTTSGVSRTNYDPTYAPVGPQTFRLEFCFFMKEKQSNGTYFLKSTENIDPKKSFSDVAAIVATIAILDAKTRVKIPATELASTMSDLVSKLADGTTPDVAAQWNNTLVTDTTIPRYVVANTRIYQRYFFLK